eukprot:7163382-Alexandrium_andersonii.AAC.1
MGNAFALQSVWLERLLERGDTDAFWDSWSRIAEEAVLRASVLADTRAYRRRGQVRITKQATS